MSEEKEQYGRESLFLPSFYIQLQYTAVILLQKWNFKKTMEWHRLERIKGLQDGAINRIGTKAIIPTDHRIQGKNTQETKKYKKTRPRCKIDLKD